MTGGDIVEDKVLDERHQVLFRLHRRDLPPPVNGQNDQRSTVRSTVNGKKKVKKKVKKGGGKEGKEAGKRRKG